ncbi:MAG: hypothetical protein CMP67_05175 [Flavobacteriales bacterium]|nr:hypothetical protein [Flavobacteriales bacterium]MBO73341.1 hypothetical protein [Flavobacteriales bacterium]|tara:strand:- start:50 stop:937 length:888 start_codon:yes stop_codon:yes gene_type:complete
MKLLYSILYVCLILGCKPEVNTIKKNGKKSKQIPTVYTLPSKLNNEYINFNSPLAINRIADIENEYFNNYEDSVSKYYGTEWMFAASQNWYLNDSISNFQLYKNKLNDIGIKGDSMHCTIYAVEALKSGMDTNFQTLDKQHKKIWNNREYAGWSIGYLLVKKYGWKAYLIISEHSDEYKRCIKNFKKNKTYWVWKQPDIPIQKLFHFETDQKSIDSLLLENEFGWGFSDQGYHTWITRFDTLKECNWLGAPSSKYDSYGNSLFKKTKFNDYRDYSSHIIVFPQKPKSIFKKGLSQ